LFVSVLAVVAAVANVAAQTVYWDIDSLDRAGAGGANPTGIWNSSISDWNVNGDGTGLPSPWPPGAIAAFAAGTNATGNYSVTVTGTQSLSGLIVEEGNVTQNFGTLNFGDTIGAPVNIASGSNFVENSTGVFTGTGGITKTGAGTLYLRGANKFSRSGSGNEQFLTINAGVVDFTSDANLGAVPSATDNGAALTLNGGTLRYAGTMGLALAKSRGVKIGASGGTVEVSNAAATLALPSGASAATALTGTGTLTKTGAGRFRLQTAQTTFTGKYVVKAGSLAFSDQNQLGAIPAATQADYFMLDGGGLLNNSGAATTLDPKRGITIGANGGALYFSGAGLAYDGIIAGSQGGGILVAGDDVGAGTAGTIALNSANTYNGRTWIATGATLSVGLLANGGVNSAIGSSSSAATNLVLDGGTLLYRGDATTTNRNFTLTSALISTIDASGVNNAPLVFTSTAPIGIAGTGSRTLVLKGTSTADNTLSLAIVDQGNNPTKLNKIDAGTWVLTNTANSYTGDTIISTGGRLKLGASGVIPDGSLVRMFTSAVFDLNGFNETVKSISGDSGTIALGSKTLTINNSGGEVYSAAITGAGGGRIVKNGAGKLTLRPTTASYDGGLTLNAGGLGIGTSNALGAGVLRVNNGATLSNAGTTAISPTNAVVLNGDLRFDDSFSTTPGAINWGASDANKWTITGADRTISVDTAAGGYGVTINQPIGEDAPGRGLVKQGNGTLRLTAANTYTGATTVLGGTLSLAQTFLPDWAGVLVGAGATLNLSFPANSPDTVVSLFIDGAWRLNGTWGAIGSGAEHESAQITGTGRLLLKPWIMPIPGDFNSDGAVDSGDYVVWRKAYGSSTSLPNDNGLGIPVGLAHLELWRQRFGNTAAASAADRLGRGAIPEPAAALLFAFGGAALPLLRTSRDRSGAR
jgi:fibronectin-binding autotransporter adhesin